MNGDIMNREELIKEILGETPEEMMVKELIKDTFDVEALSIKKDFHTENGYIAITSDDKIAFTDLLGPIFDAETLNKYKEIAEELYMFFGVQILVLLFADKNIVVTEPEHTVDSFADFKIKLAVAQ